MGGRRSGMIFDRDFDKCSLAGRQRATRPGDENGHSGAAGGGRRDGCSRRGRRAGASAETLETRDHRAQGRCRLPANGGQARLCRTRGPQARTARGERRPDRPQSAARRRARQLRRRRPGRDRGGRARRRREDHGFHWVVIPHGIMVKAGIDKMEDLKGKSIAVSAPGSFPDMLARVALAKFKIAPSDVSLAAVGGDRDRYTALLGGVVDAAVVSNEYLPLVSSKNLKMLLEGKDALPNFLRICMFSSGKLLAQRREDAIRYLSAQSKALRYALAHRDETIKLTAEATDAKADDPRPAFVFDDAVKVGAIAPDLPLPMDKLAWMQAQMVELGQIPKAGDLANTVNTDIRAQAVERAGK